MLKVIELLNKLDKNIYYLVFDNAIFIDIYYENRKLITETKKELKDLLKYLKENAENIDNFCVTSLYYFHNFHVVVKKIEVKE